MVDSEDASVEIGSLASIAEDHEYFKRMCGLVALDSTDIEPDNNQVVLPVDTEGKKRKKKDKQRKKIESGKLENSVLGKVTASKIHTVEDNSEYTDLKSKKQKVSSDDEEVSPSINHRLVPESSVTDASNKPKDTVKSTGDSSLKKNENNKGKKHGKNQEKRDKVTLVNNDSKQITSSASTVTENQTGSTAVVFSDSELSESDKLVVASINNIDDKREKLRAKIAELRAKRQYTNRERFEKRKLKRQESKMKSKQKKKLVKLQQKHEGESSKVNTGNLNKGTPAKATPSKPVFNKEGQMVFSKFDFTNSAKKEKKNQNEFHGKDYKRLMEKIEKRNEKINKVKSKDLSAGKALEEKFKWESVMHKAEGQKVKDNPELLKKAMKRKQKMKDQKQKKWEKRVEHTDKLKDDKQKKRNENIQKRKQTMKDKKMQKLKKKGRIIPGF